MRQQRLVHMADPHLAALRTEFTAESFAGDLDVEAVPVHGWVLARARRMTRPVVAGPDGSKESVAAADRAAGEALRRGLPLRPVHDWEGLPDDTDADLPEIPAPRHHARRVLRSALEPLVIGSQGTGGVGRFVSGAVAMAAVAHVDRAVVLVRAGGTAADEHLPDGSGKAPADTPMSEWCDRITRSSHPRTCVGAGSQQVSAAGPSSSVQLCAAVRRRSSPVRHPPGGAAR